MEKMIPKSIQILVAIVAITIDGSSGQSQCLTSTNVSCTEGSFRGRFDTFETRLLFSMNFTCHGTIVGWTVTGERVQCKTQYPEFQIWRADPSRGVDYYYKPGQDIPVNPEGLACEVVTKTCGQIFQCTLRADYQVSVQPGDILGVELPPSNSSGFYLYFISIPGTQDHYIYREQLQSSVSISSHLIRQLNDQLLISLEIEPVSPSTTTDGSVTVMPTTNEPTTNDFPTTENMSISPTTEEDTTEKISTITEVQQSTTDNAVKAPIVSQGTSTATAGIIAGVAIGGIITGAIITVLVTLIIVLAIVKLTKKKQSTLSLLAMNRLSGEEDIIKDTGAEMKKDVEEPVYSVVLPNPIASSDHQVDMNKNECYGTLRA